MKYMKETILVGLGAFLALLGAGMGQDVLFRTHMWVLFVVLALGTIVLLRNVRVGAGAAEDPSEYMDGPTRYGVIATTFWGVVGFLVGVIVATQLAWPDFNIEPWFNFGRMRPLHTSAVIFAFGGNALIATDQNAFRWPPANRQLLARQHRRHQSPPGLGLAARFRPR